MMVNILIFLKHDCTHNVSWNKLEQTHVFVFTVSIPIIHTGLFDLFPSLLLNANNKVNHNANEKIN